MQQIEYQNNRFHGAKQTKDRERGLRRYHSAKVIKKVGARKNIKLGKRRDRRDNEESWKEKEQTVPGGERINSPGKRKNKQKVPRLSDVPALSI